MDHSSAAEQRATAVAKLKRAASLPRMQNGRRPPMHVEAVSEGERSQVEERVEQEEVERGRNAIIAPVNGAGEVPAGRNVEMGETAEAEVEATATGDLQGTVEPRNEETDGQELVGERDSPANVGEPTKPARKRRSRSRTRSRGSKDMKGKGPAKPSPPFSSASHTNESSADEYYTSGPGEDPPPSPPLVSPIPSHFAGFPAYRFVRPPLNPVTPLFYPGTAPSTPLPSLDDIQKGVGAGLFRSNSAGAARAMALSKLTQGAEPAEAAFVPGELPSTAKLVRNNTVAGGERMAARRMLLNRLGNRINNQTDGEQTSGGEEAPPLPPIAVKKKRRRSHRRSSSRASTVVDDRDEREPAPTTPNPPNVPPSPLLPSRRNTPEPSRAASRANDEAEVFSRPLPHPSASALPGNGWIAVVEEDDLPDRSSPTRPPALPTTPARNHRPLAGPRLPHTSDAPSNASTDSAGVAVPMFLSHHATFRQDLFPASPFQTPIREPVYPDEDEALYQQGQRSRSRLATATSAFERDSEISWVADPLIERPLVDDEDEDEDDDENEDDDEEDEEDNEDEEDVVEPVPEDDADERFEDNVGQRSSREFSPEVERPSAPKPLIVDVETSPEITPAHIPPSPASVTALSAAIEQHGGIPPSPQTYPMRLSVARSPSAAAEETDYDEVRAEQGQRRHGEGTWQKVKNTFTRTGSNGGRRSRTNSLSARERRYNTDSSVSRESGVSLKLDPSVFATQQAQPPIELSASTSASASILSLAPQSAPPGGVSPVPPAASVDFAFKYADSKLFPFPALKQLEEQRRARGIPPSSSSPDVASSANGFTFPLEHVPSSASSSGATTKLVDGGRERKLSHQASDSRLWTKFSQPPAAMSPTDYFNTPPPPIISPTTSNSGSLGKLPMNRDGVRKWLSKFKSQPTTPTTPSASLPPQADVRPRMGQKPSLSDLLMQRKESELTTQSWDDVNSDKSRTPTNVTSAQRLGTPKEAAHTLDTSLDTQPRLDADMNISTSGATSPAFVLSDYSSLGFPSPPDPPSSTTPDPQSSLDDFPTRFTSESFSSTMSSHHSPDPVPNDLTAGAIIMERLDEVLGRGSKSSLWPSAIDDPPRKLILSSPVLQVANANTVKDRFLFLFNDILIVAKPILQDADVLLDATKPSPLDRKYIVKSIVQLRELKFSGDRDDPRTKPSATSNPMRHPAIRNFVNQFSKDPELAASMLLGKASTRDDVALGQLLFRMTDLDRARLGEYLSRRSSKVALKSFVDSFGLTGIRIDKALRVFLQAIHIPSRVTAGHGSSLEYLLDSFASRWYEANAAIVTYDKDLAIRLVRAIVQLHDVMHGAIASEPSITGYPKRNVISRDFIEAFRRFDPRSLVSDDLLDKMYISIRREKLYQARHPSSIANQPDIVINIKRPLPPRLTYRIQSEPVVLRIPQPDPQLSIQLFGQDLVFDPPVLTFAKSSEASFRITGTALGSKTIVIWRSGPNALAYSGLPLSSPVVIERSFMRNTFQVAFVNHTGLKRRYMFSVDDPVVRHQWAVSIKRQIEVASNISPSPSTSRAAEALAFKVLQETLVSSEETGVALTGPYPSAVDQALARLNTNGSRSRSGSVNSAFGRAAPRRVGTTAHVRSKSRSQLYRQNGAGKLESELDDQDEPPLLSSSPSQRLDGRLWNGHDLEVVCRQNSSIPFVLAYLQVGLGSSGNAHGNGTAS